MNAGRTVEPAPPPLQSEKAVEQVLSPADVEAEIQAANANAAKIRKVHKAEQKAEQNSRLSQRLEEGGRPFVQPSQRYQCHQILL